MGPESSVVIEVFGEGKTDVGHDPAPHPPTRGVVPILLHTVCGKPSGMLVKRYGMPFMMRRGTLRQKVKFAKKQARVNQSAGAVFVVDSEGNLKRRNDELAKGRDMEPGNFPMAIGVAHPCIEAWLLAEARAIRQALQLPTDPDIPDKPETLPAPSRDSQRNPKRVLATIAGSGKKELSVDQKEKIAAAMNDMDMVRRRCPKGFAPFAEDVVQHIRPLC